MISTRRRFTLIELLVVVAIIAILASILLPAVEVARQKAMTATCMANLRQMGQGFAIYATDFNGEFPRSRDGTSGPGRKNQNGWMRCLKEGAFQDMELPPYWIYPGDFPNEINICPTVRQGLWNYPNDVGSVERIRTRYYSTYGPNNRWAHGNNLELQIYEIDRPDFPLIADTGVSFVQNKPPVQLFTTYGGRTYDFWSYETGYRGNAVAGFPGFFHGPGGSEARPAGSCNQLNVDGSVENIQAAKVQRYVPNDSPNKHDYWWDIDKSHPLP